MPTSTAKPAPLPFPSVGNLAAGSCPQDSAQQATWRSEQLLGPHMEVLIDHNGVLYRLRVTGQGKLILTK
ncbi:MAG: hemin uptake protein HemP [Chitinophagaceae bacterium]|nr:hemin uptake protein HemP [Rubrivivax sp.]